MIHCPHCQSKSINKNGIKANNKQNYLCRTCGKQFQIEYKNQGANPVIKNYVQKALCRNCGVADIEKIFNVSKPYILRTLVNYAEKLEIKPQKQHYKSLQIDEFWTYIGTKKNKKWLLYAYYRETQEIVAYVFGDRSEKTIQALYAKLAENKITVDEFCTDNWKAFAKILPKNKHKIGKQYTKAIEGNNNYIRSRNRRTVRKTCGFSKKLENHEAAMKMCIYCKNYNYC